MRTSNLSSKTSVGRLLYDSSTDSKIFIKKPQLLGSFVLHSAKFTPEHRLSLLTLVSPTILEPEHHPLLSKILPPRSVPSSQKDVETEQLLSTASADIAHQFGTGRRLQGSAGNSSSLAGE